MVIMKVKVIMFMGMVTREDEEKTSIMMVMKKKRKMKTTMKKVKTTMKKMQTTGNMRVILYTSV